MTDSTNRSGHASQFVYDTSGAGQTKIPGASTFTKMNRGITKHSALTGIVIGAAMGGIIGAGATAALSGFTGGSGTVIVNNTSHVNWVTAVAARQNLRW